MKSRLLALVLLGAMAAGIAGCASGFTSVSTDPDGKYVLTGWELRPFVAQHGFVWICDYDADSKTLTVREELPR